MNEPTRTLTLAHSPDSDDAFMFWGLAGRHIGIDGIEFQHNLSDIQSLNQAALEARYDITAISLHTYPYIAHQYALMNVGASVGDGYGPILVSKSRHSIEDIPELSVAIPGTLTTAALTLRLAIPNVRTRQMTFDTIMDAVKDGEVDAGVIIHEGQLTYKDENLHNVLDLGKWWREETGLPLPLGANVIKRDLGYGLMNQVAAVIRASIAYAFENRTEALAYAREFSGELKLEQVDEFVSMYVNDYTIDWGQKGRSAVRELLKRGAEAGIIPPVDNIDFVG